MSRQSQQLSSTVTVCNVRVFGLECGLLNIEDTDIRVNILFAEYHEFDDWNHYDRSVPLPNWVGFLLDRHVMGKKLVLSAELVVKANRNNRLVYFSPFTPFSKLHEVHHGSDHPVSAG